MELNFVLPAEKTKLENWSVDDLLPNGMVCDFLSEDDIVCVKTVLLLFDDMEGFTRMECTV